MSQRPLCFACKIFALVPDLEALARTLGIFSEKCVVTNAKLNANESRKSIQAAAAIVVAVAVIAVVIVVIVMARALLMTEADGDHRSGCSPSKQRVMVAEKKVHCMDYNVGGVLATTDKCPIVAVLYNKHSNSILTAAGSAVTVHPRSQSLCTCLCLEPRAQQLAVVRMCSTRCHFDDWESHPRFV